MRKFAPLYRATIGFDQLFDSVESSAWSDWPPYDIEKLDEHGYRITIALAGFAPSDLEIVQEGPYLVVTGRQADSDDRREMLHRGIVSAGFRQAFSLADHVKVLQANLADGLLSIDLVREVPEQLKPRRIEICTGTPPLASTEKVQMGQSARDEARAA